jgi:hypothetical protein
VKGCQPENKPLGVLCLSPERLTDRISAARALRSSRRAAPRVKYKARRLTQIARPRQLQMLVRPSEKDK